MVFFSCFCKLCVPRSVEITTKLSVLEAQKAFRLPKVQMFNRVKWGRTSKKTVLINCNG